MSDPTRRGFLKGVLGVIAGGAAVATTAKAEVPKLLPAVPEDVKRLEGGSYLFPEWAPRERSLYEANTYSMKLMVSDEELAEDAMRMLKEGFDD